MSKPGKDLFEEKMALVYKYNQASPLFIRAANIELKKNNAHIALDILNNGIKTFPLYPTAYILLGKVHLELGNFDLAETAFRRGCELTNSGNCLSYYLSELENKKSGHPNIKQSRRVSFFESSIEENNPREIKSTEKETSEKETSGLSFDERLEDVAKEISQAKIIVSDKQEQTIPSDDSKKSENAPIISETLAKIYMSQGKFKEAIEVYKKLQIKSPDKSAVYQLKIDEIQRQLGDLEWL